MIKLKMITMYPRSHLIWGPETLNAQSQIARSTESVETEIFLEGILKRLCYFSFILDWINTLFIKPVHVHETIFGTCSEGTTQEAECKLM